jgi:peptidoglycan hydrolase-like protein with peptidoglycan-binding domain
MQVNSSTQTSESFSSESLNTSGFDSSPAESQNAASRETLLDDFLSFESSDPKLTFAEKNLIDDEPLVQTRLTTALEVNEAVNAFDYNQIQGLSNNGHVTREFLAEVEAMAGRLGTQPEYLLAVMSFETGGTFNPAIRNGIGATGLIQFLPSTAQGLGTTTDELAGMSAVEQLRYVERYFDQPHFRGRLGTLEGLYTAVLSGSARSDPNDVLFERGTRAYDLNPLDWNRDGQITAGEAVTPVAARLYGGVTAVQQRLVDLGFVPEDQQQNFADGRWGPNTAAAVARFQRANNLTANGLLDDRTGRALFNLVAPNAPDPPSNPGPVVPTGTLREGDRGADVRRLQNILVRLGFMTQAQMNTGPGIFGSRTDTALKRFQRAANLTADGIFGRNTRQAMNDIISGIGRTTRARNTNLTKGIQDRLVELGYMTRAQVNTGYGTFGPQTEAAVKRFQARNNIRQTGIVDEQTFRALFSSSARRSSGAGNTGGGTNFSVAANGRHYTVNQGILMTDDLRPRLQQLADAYFQRTGRNLHVTSGYRPPARQAAAMYDLIVNRGESYVRNLYRNKTAVDQILTAYRANRGSRSGAVSAMTRVIENQVAGGTYISSHLRSRALDLSISTNLGVLRQLVGQMGGTVLDEGDHYHVQL